MAHYVNELFTPRSLRTLPEVRHVSFRRLIFCRTVLDFVVNFRYELLIRQQLDEQRLAIRFVLFLLTCIRSSETFENACTVEMLIVSRFSHEACHKP